MMFDANRIEKLIDEMETAALRVYVAAHGDSDVVADFACDEATVEDLAPFRAEARRLIRRLEAIFADAAADGVPDDDMAPPSPPARFVRIVIDDENTSPEWWEAGGQNLWRAACARYRIDQATTVGTLATPDEAAAFVEAAEKIPGWNNPAAPESAPHPVVVVDDGDGNAHPDEWEMIED